MPPDVRSVLATDDFVNQNIVLTLCFTTRGSGTCHPECMSLACNFDNGDCVTQRMDAAGVEAGQVCDREVCSILDQTNAKANADGCNSACFTSGCDWSRNLCFEARSNVRACPLIDAAAYASIKTAQR